MSENKHCLSKQMKSWKFQDPQGLRWALEEYVTDGEEWGVEPDKKNNPKHLIVSRNNWTMQQNHHVNKQIQQIINKTIRTTNPLKCPLSASV